MKRSYLSLIITLSLFCVFSCVKETQNLDSDTVTEKEVYVPGTMLLKFDDSTVDSIEKQALTKSGPLTKTGRQAIDEIFDYLEVSSLERTFPDGGKWEARQRKAGLHQYYYVKYNDSKALQTKAGEMLSSVEGVELAQPLPNYKPLSEPVFNDPSFSAQWHYENTGSSSKLKKGADINVLPVWQEFTAGSSDVIVAVIDGGVDMTNPDIAPVVIPAGNSGSYNFIDGKAQITAHEHGTHVAGTVAAINNNGIGVCGVAGGDDGSGGVRILNCQVFNNEQKYGVGFAQALQYAANNGAVIAQNSWGTDYKTEADALRGYISDDVRVAVDYFIDNAGIGEDGTQTGPMKGGVVFFAAGNDNFSIGWPAAYEKVIAVGAFGSTGQKASYSNYGSWVDIAAPGGDVNVGPAIYSTIPGGYGYLQGTSMACPHASGVAALLVSYYGCEGFTNEMLVEKLLGGANSDFLPQNANIGPMLDAYGAF
ncbi:MAG: S8 family serine peptidase, partial [Candidatus Cryptobacteroides sp.]